MKTVFIYALREPGPNGTVRYIGKSANPSQRLRSHFFEIKKEKNRRANWIRSLLFKGLKPVLEIIDEVPEEHWQQWEVAYIEYFREQENRLVNSTEGGEGVHNPSKETRARLRDAKTGEKNPFFGRRHTPEHCKNKSMALSGANNPMFGKRLSETALAHQRETHINRKTVRNTSGFVRISWDKKNRNWQAKFRAEGRDIHVGRFKQLEDAVFARALAMDKYFSR